MGLFSSLGTAVGGYFGGSAGAAIGAGIGGSIDGKKANKRAKNAANNSAPQFNPLVQKKLPGALNNVTGAPDIEQFTGPRVATMNDMQRQGIGGAQGVAGNLDAGAATSFQGFQDVAGGGRINNNPFLEQQIQAMQTSGNQNLQQQILANRNNAVAGGGVGGTRQGIAEGLSTARANDSMFSAEADMRSTQLNQDLSNQLQALTNQGAILGGQSAGNNVLLGAGGMLQNQAQAEIGGDMQLQSEQQNQQFDRDQQILATLLGSPSNTRPTPAYTDPGMSAMGAALTGYQLFQGNQQAPINPYVSQGVPTGGAHTGGMGF